ncbi:hypothetical protein D5F01_LYC11523 [Larimichthys crocea]|uniref:Signal-induced proliferation-associated 1-like protein C-terminal domain-containing protein n=1 Tax=Larimichthys crocea TaxID=215358 RepID=A0A6G0IES1_LARCR|nr:hypothetical protein D5F01_LYC11523 [Larimichthys crocea]
MPRSPTTRHGPSRRASHKSLGDLSATESSELEQERKRQQLQDPVLMPLPDSGADGPLDWAHLVDAAKAFEEQRLVFLAAQEESSMAESTAATSPQQAEPQAAPLRQPSPGETPACLMGKVSQLESMVKVLQEDLEKGERCQGVTAGSDPEPARRQPASPGGVVQRLSQAQKVHRDIVASERTDMKDKRGIRQDKDHEPEFP